MNANQLITIGHGFNNAVANLNVNAQIAPGIRIGLHRAEANRSGLDYIGSGVNQAARISAEATESEVLISVSSLQEARHSFREVGRRTLALKGIPDPVEVASIAWN